MKTSTKKLIIHTILGIIAWIIFLDLNKAAHNPFLITRARSCVEIGIYICPFIGLIYWMFNRHFE